MSDKFLALTKSGDSTQSISSVRYTKCTISIRKRIMHVRRIELLLVLVIAATQMPFAKAAEIKYIVGSEMPYYPGDFLNEHFRPSSVYKYGTDETEYGISRDYRSVIDPTDKRIYLPQDLEQGKSGNYATSWNQAGDIIGESFERTNENVGFIFRNGEMTYLSEQRSMTSQGAQAINDRG